MEITLNSKLEQLVKKISTERNFQGAEEVISAALLFLDAQPLSTIVASNGFSIGESKTANEASSTNVPCSRWSSSLQQEVVARPSDEQFQQALEKVMVSRASALEELAK